MTTRDIRTIPGLQAVLDAWVMEYNTARPHEPCGRRPPIGGTGGSVRITRPGQVAGGTA